jgi:hypothetical protein
MKTNLLKSVVAISFVLLLSSCATHWGTMSGSASLASNNFKVVKMASGTASSSRIFGFGGMAQDALVLEAKKDMMQNNPLKEGQAMANVTVDFKNSSKLFVSTEKVTVTADIVEFK